MNFKLTTSGRYYTQKEIDKYVQLGFKFAPYEHSRSRFIKVDSLVEIDINSLEDLLAFSEIYGPLIVHKDTVEIHDDYRVREY